MQYKIDECMYDVVITRKYIKNCYIRVKDDLKIYVNVNLLTSNHEIVKLLDNNQTFLRKSILSKKKKQFQTDNYYYLGNLINIIIDENNSFEGIMGSTLYLYKDKDIIKWYMSKIKEIFSERVNYWYNIFEEKIPYPKVKYRKMKTRWGVCNKRDSYITLNTELIYKNIIYLDYVVVHELSHFIYFNHSKDFWQLVEKYLPNYKNIRKELKE